MSRISILQYTRLYTEDINNYGGEFITFERTPAMEMQYIQDNTQYAFADIPDTSSPIKQNLDKLKKQKKAWNKFHYIPATLLIFGIISIVALAMMDKSSDYFPLMQKVGIVGAFCAITFPFQYLIVAALINKPSKEFAKKLTAAQARMYLLTDGTLTILNDNYDDHAGEKLAFKGVMCPEDNIEFQKAYQELFKTGFSKEVMTSDIRKLNRDETPYGNEQVFPFKNCVYIQEISDVREYAEQDSYEITCSGVMYVIFRPFGHRRVGAHRREHMREPFNQYAKVVFSNEKLPLPKRYVDAEIYEKALADLKR